MSSVRADWIGSLNPRRQKRLRVLARIDPVGPIVAGHAVLLASLGSTNAPVGILSLAAGVLLWRSILTALANRSDRERRLDLMVARAVGSLAAVGGMMFLDGGTESPLFFLMLVVVVWAATMLPLRRFMLTGSIALLIYLAVILGVPDLTVTSFGRFGLYVAFVGMLAWARAVSDYWREESRASKTLVGDILMHMPTAFVLLEAATGRSVFANPGAVDLGLDRPDEVDLARYGQTGSRITLADLVTDAYRSGKAMEPALYVKSMGLPDERFLRLFVAQQEAGIESGMVMVCAEDVSAQVAAGEQQRRFFESANHQFRTPLSPIMAYASMIADGELPIDELREAGRAISEGANRIETLLDRISQLLRLQRRPHRALQLMSVGQLVEGHLFRIAPELRSIVLVSGGSDLLLRCEADPLAKALVELARNGMRHGVAPVRVTGTATSEGVALMVTDDGPGPDLDPTIPLDHTWGVLSRPEVMPPEMGNRLGISYAFTLAQTAGGTMRFHRNADSWRFVLEFPGIEPQRAGTEAAVLSGRI